MYVYKAFLLYFTGPRNAKLGERMNAVKHLDAEETAAWVCLFEKTNKSAYEIKMNIE